jgi:hypothetical protein
MDPEQRLAKRCVSLDGDGTGLAAQLQSAPRPGEALYEADPAHRNLNRVVAENRAGDWRALELAGCRPQ